MQNFSLQNSAKLEKFGLKNSAKLKNCIFVGDSLKDKEAAKNAKMPFLWAKWGENSTLNSKNLNKNEFEFGNADELKILLEKFV